MFTFDKSKIINISLVYFPNIKETKLTKENKYHPPSFYL